MTWTPHIQVELVFLRPEDGGRTTPVYSGYRSQFYYGGRDWDAVLDFLELGVARPGETVIAHVSFLTPENHRGILCPGMSFQVREGQRVVATGTVTRTIAL